ncbi:methyltransferase domain-containing protein [Porticoccaceae bacterium LTM1]|nr:methyltransferase domain-containing protein [Porticoccaceae bacterium LTM1]
MKVQVFKNRYGQMIEDENYLTNRLIKNAGISEGMRVLDLGCGKGDLSSILAKAVGPWGEVVGIDRNRNILEMAKHRLASQNLSNVNFLSVDLSGPLPDIGMFDAIVGRRVLMYLSNPGDMLRNVLGHLKNSGIVAFQEVDSMVSPIQVLPHPLHEQVNKWIWDTLDMEGANLNMGFALPSLLKQLGVVVDGVKAEANVQGPQSEAPLATVVRAILHRIVDQNVASYEEVDVQTLEARLNRELSDGSVFIGDMSFAVWGRKV